MKEIEELQQQITTLQERLNALAEKTTKFEVGKWYRWSGIKPTVGRLLGRSYSYPDCWRLDVMGDLNSYSGCHERFLCPATESEIEEALLKEAAKRGFVSGAKFISIDGADITLYGTIFHYDHSLDALACSDFGVKSQDFLYQKGLWAKITTLTIGGHKAQYDGDTVTFGCKSFKKSFVENLHDIMKTGGFDFFSIEGHDVTTSQVAEILDGFK